MSLPNVSLILFAYNQEQFISDAARSCLQQDYGGQLEILFSDDCSTDNTFDVLQNMAQLYAGQHTVIVRRNAVNLGIGAHYNCAITEATGELIFTAAGDDISHPQRVSLIVAAWLAAKKRPDLLTSNLQKIQIDGTAAGVLSVSDLSLWQSPEQWIKKRPYVVGAAHAFTRRLHEKFGDFLPDLVYEDQIMAFRATLMGGGLKVSQPLVLYREGGISQSKSTLASAYDYQNWSFRHFSRQHAQYLQIQKDLVTANRSDLWLGKLRRNLQEARFVLTLHACQTFDESVQAALRSTHSRWLFRLKHLLYLSLPGIAISIQRLQQRLKKCGCNIDS